MSIRLSFKPLYLSALAGLGIWIGFPNDLLSVPLLALLWPLALSWLGKKAVHTSQALRWGWLATLGGSFAALYWLALPVTQVGGLPWPGAVACAIIISFILSSQGGIFTLLAFRWRSMPSWKQCLLLFLSWYLLEYIYAIVIGFPWLTISAALAQWPLLIQFARISGAYLLGSIWLLAILLICSHSKNLIVIGLLLALFLGAYGYVELKSEYEAGTPFSCLMVQGNVDQNQKWVAAFQQATLDKYIELTQKGLQASGSAELIIWPETALPFFYETNPVLANQVRAAVRDFDTALLFGAPGIENQNTLFEEEIYNRAFLLNRRGDTIGQYDKMHLVPFGEYLPEWLKLDFLEALLQGVGVYSEGSNPDPLRYDNLALGVLICYEGIFPWLAQERVAAGANILVDISNDGWFGFTPASKQHLYLTVPRCVEQGRWLMRSTNTGITAVIDSKGQLVLAGSMFESAFFSCHGELQQDTTIYHHIAPWLPLAALLCLILLVAKRKGNKVI